MYSEQYIFWQMVLSSPAVIALSGGFAVAIISLVVAILNNWHSSKIKKWEWECAETLRKEKRIFTKKCHVYENYASCFETTYGKPISSFDQNAIPTLMQIMLYGSYDVKKAAYDHFQILYKYNLCTNVTEIKNFIPELERTANMLHTKMIEDIEQHSK
ncbi:hypothetical protein [Bilophila wadsworthia]|jgi:hypothetical protein|uniref:hypothetical protein n=1 Tax=Bilophila wadsworthia TaxID=35833 RepID=UPI00266D0354|nr:hypothetical protein [Bilophila wadsworthia]